MSALQGYQCAPEGGVWNARGKLVNTTKATQTYQVRVAVVKKKGFQVLGTDQAEFTVDPGKSADVSFTKLYSGADGGLICVPTVLSGKK